MGRIKVNKKSKFDFIRYSSYTRLDYRKHKIWVYGGIRSNSNKREPKTIKWIENCMLPNSVLFDVGANIGAYSLVAASNGLQIYAFEPAVMNFVILLKNIIRNKFESKIIPLNIPLSNKHSLDYFNYHDMAAGSSIHTFGKAIDFRGQKFTPVYKQLLLSSTIDDIVNIYGLPCPNHIKIDVDGNEFQVLSGASRVLARSEVKTICVELIDGKADKKQADALLSGLGFMEDTALGTRVNKIYKKYGD